MGGSAMQELVVREAAASFREQFPSDTQMQGKAFSAAVKSLSGEQVATGEDPVAAHFASAFQSLSGVDLMTTKGNSKGTLAERVAFAQQAKDLEFQQTFMVSAAEAAEIKSIAAQVKSGSDFDFSKLSAEAAKRLDDLYMSINAKVGYSLPETLGTKEIKATSDAEANTYIEQVNTQLAAAAASLREAHLKAFVSSF